MRSPSKKRKTNRRREIMAAAFECFIQYGYAKTTFEDVARKAEVSRSLLYAYFTDKNQLFLSVAEDLLDEQRRKTDEVLKSDSRDQDKLLAILEHWSVELYARVVDSPHGIELLAEGYRAWEEIGVKFKKYLIAALAGFVGGSELAEMMVLCIKGLQSDRPPVPVMRRRLQLLADLGWRKRGKA